MLYNILDIIVQDQGKKHRDSLSYCEHF